MTSPVEEIRVECARCGVHFDDWRRPSVNLALDDFDDDYLRQASTATCPECGHVHELSTLVVDGDVWRFGGRSDPSEEARLAPNGYYSFDDLDGGYNGLVRVSGDGAVFERVHNGAWVIDHDLARYFVNPGTSYLEPVKGDVLRGLAARYGVDLQDPPDLDPSFPSPKRPTAKPSADEERRRSE
jgi:hypothetical protein